MKEFEHYLVGGAVRDALLKRASKDRDWVVTGATEEQMLALGYVPVARNMPVFVHPETKEEYALARRERKRGEGHKGFVFNSSPEVRLEEDLRRRDLTINAMARHPDGRLIDPCGGQRDLQQRILRHVSDAFVEDPLRLFRVARFAAELSPYGFSVAAKTLRLMHLMALSGELATLPAERIWNETARALASPAPQVFFGVLQQCGGLDEWFAEISQSPNLGDLERSIPRAPPWRWAGLLFCLNAEDLEALQQRLSVPKRFSQSAKLARDLLPLIRQGASADAKTRQAVLRRADAFRRPNQFKELLQLHQTLGNEPPSEWWQGAFQAAADAGRKIPKPPATGAQDYALQLERARLEALKAWR